MRIRNEVLGRYRRIYPLLLCLILTALVAGAALAWSGIVYDYPAFSFLLICMGSALLLYAGIEGIEIVKVLKQTIKSVQLDDEEIRCKTFDDRTLVVRRSSLSRMKRKKYPAIIQKSLFPPHLRHYKIKSVNKSYLLSGTMEDLDQIFPGSELSLNSLSLSLPSSQSQLA